MQQWHSLAFTSAIVQWQYSHTGARVFPIECHKGGRGGNVIAIGLIGTYTYVTYTCFRLGYNRCCILVLGCFKTPGHCVFVNTSSCKVKKFIASLTTESRCKIINQTELSLSSALFLQLLSSSCFDSIYCESV